MPKKHSIIYTRSNILPRAHISSTLAKAVSSSPLVLLTAPMGYGKTTAARDLLPMLSHQVFTLTANPGPCNALYWWDMACGQLTAQGSKLAPVLQRMGFPSDPVRMRRTLEQGKAYLAARPTLLVIDDYHFVTAPEINMLLEALVREAIPNFCLMVVSRTRPGIALEELRAKGFISWFDQALLAFSKQETIDYFSRNGIADVEAAKHAWAFSEGWPTAICLSLQSYRTHGVIKPVNDIEKLLSETVFSSYNAKEQSLLLQLSALDSCSARQAVAVSGDMAAPQRLRNLHDRNAFLRYDEAEGTYRLHSIFRTYLRNLLEDSSHEALRAEGTLSPGASTALSIDKPSLYRRGGEWYAGNGDLLQAMRFFFQAGREEDLLRILELFAIPGDGLLVMFDPEGLAAMMRAIPWSVRCRCPIGYLAFIYHYMSRVNLHEGLAALEEAKRHFITENNIPLEQQQKVCGEIELIHGIEDFNNLDVMRDRHAKAHALLRGSSSISHPQLIWTFGSPHVAFLYLREAGSYHRMVKLVEKNLHYYQEMTKGCSAGAQDLFRAEYLLETEATHNVASYLKKADYRAASKDQLASLIAITFTRARLHLAEGKVQEAQGALQELAPSVLATGNPLLSTSLDLCKGYIAAVLGCEEDIPRWLHQGDMASSCNFYQGVNFIHIVHGKALLAAGDWPCLEALGEDIPRQFGKYSNLFGQIHALLFRAIATYHQQGQEQALGHLIQAISLARPDHIICSIAEYGNHIRPLLLHLREWHPTDFFIGLLSKRTKRYAQLSATSEMQLAPREQAILERAIDGASYKNIAEALGITAASVGNTMSRVYAKLNVKNRAQAIKKYHGRE